jgi:hypothetical protein
MMQGDAMPVNEDSISSLDRKSPEVSPGNYSPVNVYMEDSVGAIFLGFLSGILLIGWMRAEARYRALLNEKK